MRNETPLLQITESERVKLSRLIETELGIRMPAVKKELLQGRLSKRLQHLNLKTYREYYEYLNSPEGRLEEYRFFTDTITTNKTDFFREEGHFQLLQTTLLPQLAGQREIKVWSAACSTGEEPYSAAMVMEDFRRRTQSSFQYRVFATDISLAVLETALAGIYRRKLIAPIPELFKKQFLLRHKTDPDLFRIAPSLRARLNFRQLNLLGSDIEMLDGFDIIFCRNVLIYFDKNNQQKVLRYLYSCLKPGGYLFVGHAETVFHMRHLLGHVAPSVYRKISEGGHNE